MTPTNQPWFPKHRDKILFFTGLAGVIFETALTVFKRPVDPSLLVLFAGMMGLPAFLPSSKKGDDK